jgi:hypothetical protein
LIDNPITSALPFEWEKKGESHVSQVVVGVAFVGAIGKVISTNAFILAFFYVVHVASLCMFIIPSMFTIVAGRVCHIEGIVTA